MKKTYEKKSMNLGNLTMYLEDLVKMGFASEHIDAQGKQQFQLTELGKKSGLEGLQN